MTNQEFKIKDTVEIFPQQGGWHYVRVPEIYTEMSKDFADRGLVPIFARLGKTEWKTSLLPMGDGTHFIALNATVRKNENVSLGDAVSIYFRFGG